MISCSGVERVNVEHLRLWFSVWCSAAPSDLGGIRMSISFYRIPKVITNKGKDMEELTRKRHTGFIPAISRADL